MAALESEIDWLDNKDHIFRGKFLAYLFLALKFKQVTKNGHITFRKINCGAHKIIASNRAK